MANPFTIIVEDGLPLFDVAPSATATVFELPATGPFPAVVTPVHSIGPTQGWGVRVRWSTSGALSPLLAGDWVVTLYMDRMGGGPFSVPGSQQTTPLIAATPQAYEVDFSFPAGAIPAGAYRLAVTITMRGPAPGHVPGPLGGVGDGPLLQFY